MVEIITIGGFESAAATAVWYKIYNKCNKCRDRELPDQVRDDTGQARGDRQKHSPDQNTITAREFYIIETVNDQRSTINGQLNDQRSTVNGQRTTAASSTPSPTPPNTPSARLTHTTHTIPLQGVFRSLPDRFAIISPPHQLSAHRE